MLDSFPIDSFKIKHGTFADPQERERQPGLAEDYRQKWTLKTQLVSA